MAKGNSYVGIDLHKRKLEFVMMSSSGEVVEAGGGGIDGASVAKFACRLRRCHQVVLEPLKNSYWFIDQVQPYAGSVHLADSGKVRLIAESRLKNVNQPTTSATARLPNKARRRCAGSCCRPSRIRCDTPATWSGYIIASVIEARSRKLEWPRRMPWPESYTMSGGKPDHTTAESGP